MDPIVGQEYNLKSIVAKADHMDNVIFRGICERTGENIQGMAASILKITEYNISTNSTKVGRSMKIENYRILSPVIRNNLTCSHLLSKEM